MVNVKVTGRSDRPRQGRLWSDMPVDPGPPVKAAIAEVINGSRMSRYDIVVAMNKLGAAAGITTRATEAMLDKWTAPGSDNHHIPHRMLRLFCQAAGDNLPLEVYARTFPGVKGLKTDEDEELLQWARREIAIKKLKKENRKVAPKLGIE